MISIEEARKWVLDKSFLLDEELIEIDRSVGMVLARDITASIDIPSFRNSAMDGYSVLRSDLETGMRTFKIMGEIQAGRAEKVVLKSGEAYRIFTGAVCPENSDMVVIQEKAKRTGDVVEFIGVSHDGKSNIREIGEQIKKGEIALKAGHVINPASIGLLASFGISEVPVYRKPRISVITTGNELKKAGEDLLHGEIYESNSYSLKAALAQHDFEIYSQKTVVDDQKATSVDIGKLISECDALIISGGISVGDYDFVKKSLEENDVEEVFYKVDQKPGKPMYFGVKGEKLVFALPGNPASLLVCFYEYVLPSLKKRIGLNPNLRIKHVKLKNDFHFSGPRPEFFRGRASEDFVEILTGQSSFMLLSFAEANCLVYIRGEKRIIPSGSPVEVHYLY